MKSFIDVSGRVSPVYKEIAEKVALDVIKFSGQPDIFEVAVQFVSESEIKRINKEFRNIDRVTDVLSFPAIELSAGDIVNENSFDVLMLKNEKGLVQLGDMVLCAKRMREQAKDFGVTIEAELKKLVIHSMLHLFGYDHIKDEDFEIMNKKEKQLDEKIKI